MLVSYFFTRLTSVTPLTCRGSYECIGGLRHNETVEEMAEGPWSQSETDLGMSCSCVTVRLCGRGPLLEPRYSHLLSGAQYFTNSIVGEEG